MVNVSFWFCIVGYIISNFISMNSAEFLKPQTCSYLIAICGVFLFFLARAIAVAVEEKPVGGSSGANPDMILILTDDQGYGDLSAHGHPFLKTPNVDRLRARSVRFENFYVSASCSPTRAALLAGMHEFRNGVTHTQQPRDQLHRDAVILPQLLATAGYRNGIVGKWHLGNQPGFAPRDRGFDWCSTNEGGPREHFDPVMIRNGKKAKAAGYREDVYFDDAMDFIKESGERPYFLYLSTYSPHDPLEAPEEFVAPFRNKVPEEQAKYLGMVANLDYNLGRLLKFLEDSGRDKNTVIILMNDNGQTWGLDIFNAGMRGCKATAWQGGTRAFSFWSWPGKWPAHEVENLAAHIDVLPTLCQLAGVEIPEKLQNELEGFSLVPLLEANAEIAWHDDRMLFQHVARWPGGLASEHKFAMVAARQGHYLLVKSRPCDSPKCTTANHGYQCATLRNVEQGERNATYTEGNAAFHWGLTPRGRWSLFDVKNDPACQNDLSETEPARVGAMAAAYEKWWDAVFPVMLERGGDREIVWSVPTSDKANRSRKNSARASLKSTR